MFVNSFSCNPIELGGRDSYVELYKNPSKREVTSVLRYHGSGRFGIFKKDVIFWRGDIFHSTVMRWLWKDGYYKQWSDWDEKLYFERYGGGIVWSTKPTFEDDVDLDLIATLKYSYPRMHSIIAGNSDNVLWSING